MTHPAHGNGPGGARRARAPAGPRYSARESVDFVVVGAGAAGGVVARELSRAGFRVVVLEQGPYLHEADFTHDELAVQSLNALTNDPRLQPNTYRTSEAEEAKPKYVVRYGRLVGGGSVHFTANFWRFHEIDFLEGSRTGRVAGSDLADWPITYAELEPYYTRAEWELGVSGQAGASPFDPPRSRPYPLPPLPIKPSGVLTERAARKLGWHAYPAPVAILSEPYRGRPACIQCGKCEFYGCEVRAKSSTLAAMIPDAERTGRCEIRPHSYVRKIEIDRRGRAIGVKYFDAARREVFQRARAVVVSANGAETPRLLLMSRAKGFPDGLANGSGVVGRHLMFNGGAFVGGLFEHEINGYRGMVVTRVIHDLYELDPALGLAGGGGFDFRFDMGPIDFALGGMPDDAPTWGAEYKQLLRRMYTRSIYVLAHTTQLPAPTNSISLDPALKDAWGLPAIRVTFSEHPNDVRLYSYFRDRAHELLDAAGAVRRWDFPLDTYYPAVHLLGTCRMGDDPATSVVDRYHRTHEVPNLFLVDGSSFVTSGRGQPTLTIQALAFRASEHMARMARRGELG
ncbi:MAG TPA: GMC family oxidoreductase [Gemmatimonadales bacterium]|nr:GMC family oxidoreductase [Gemmatimonadales bacterium]